MSKQEVINTMRMALNGKVPASVITENVKYYEEYINTQIRMGRKEQEVLQSLGDPRLIARTIVETNGGSGQAGEGSSGVKREYSGYREPAYEQNRENRPFGKMHRIPGWLVLLIIGIIILVVIGFVLSVISFLAPFFLVMMLVVFLIKLFRDWLN